MPHQQFQFPKDGACESHRFKRKNEIGLFIKTKNSLVKKLKMKLFSAAVLATAVFAGTKNRRAPGAPQEAQSCSSARGIYQVGNRIWPKWQYGNNSNQNYEKCIFSNILGSGRTGRALIQRAVWFLDPTLNHDELFNPLFVNWRVLTGQDPVKEWDDERQWDDERKGKIDCGFAPVGLRDYPNEPDTEGYINQCGLMCPGLDTRIDDVESAKNAIKKFLDGYRAVINDQFGTKWDGNTCMFDETSFYTNEVTLVKYRGWVNGWYDPCRKQDMCAQLVTNAYGDIAKFEKILGEKIPNLQEIDGKRRFEHDMEWLMEIDEETNYPDDLYRTGIFGIGKFVVESKREERHKECKSRNPTRPCLDPVPDFSNSDFFNSGPGAPVKFTVNGLDS